MNLTRFSILFLAILSSTNAHSQVCSNEYSPESVVSSRDEVMEKAKEIFGENPSQSEIEEEYRSAVEENMENLKFEPSEAMSPEEISSLEVGKGTASIEDPANIAGAMVYAGIDSYAAFMNPNASKLDKATAVTEWIPGVGFVMNMIDGGVNAKKYNREMHKHQKAAREKAEKLNNLMHYDDSPEEQKTLDKLEASITQTLRTSSRDLFQEFIKDLVKFYKASYLLDVSAVLTSTNKHFANKIIEGSTDFTKLIDFLKKSLVAADTVTPSLISSTTATTCGITENSTTESSNNFFEGKDLQQVEECLDAIFEDYETTLDFRSPENWMYSLIDSYEKSRNHFLANIKLSTINEFHKTIHSDETLNSMCDIYKEHANGYLDYKTSLLDELGKLEFFKTNNLDSEGRSPDGWCWRPDVVFCTATSTDVMVECDFDNNWCRGMTDNEKFDSQKACYKWYEARGNYEPAVCEGAFRTFCMYGPEYVDSYKWCGQYCTYRDVYLEDKCEIVDYHPDRDTYLVQVKERLLEAREEAYEACLSPYEKGD